MASPQKENGYTAISNELLDVVVRTPLPGRHKDLWFFIIRKTYGYHKKCDRISLSQFTQGTGIDRSGVCRIIKDLVKWVFIIKNGSVYSVVKDYTQWVVAQRPLVGSGVHTTRASGVQDNQVVAHTPHTKETIQKKLKESTTKNSSDAKFTLKSMTINLEDLNDEDVTYEEEYVKTPKKYKGRTKAYTRIAIRYLQLRGEAGDVLRYFKDIKELWELAEKSVKPEKVEAEIIGRIEVMKKYAEIEKISWGLGAVVKNWNAILKDYSKKVQL